MKAREILVGGLGRAGGAVAQIRRGIKRQQDRNRAGRDARNEVAGRLAQVFERGRRLLAGRRLRVGRARRIVGGRGIRLRDGLEVGSGCGPIVSVAAPSVSLIYGRGS